MVALCALIETVMIASKVGCKPGKHRTGTSNISKVGEQDFVVDSMKCRAEIIEIMK